MVVRLLAPWEKKHAYSLCPLLLKRNGDYLYTMVRTTAALRLFRTPPEFVFFVRPDPSICNAKDKWTRRGVTWTKHKLCRYADFRLTGTATASNQSVTAWRWHLPRRCRQMVTWSRQDHEAGRLHKKNGAMVAGPAAAWSFGHPAALSELPKILDPAKIR